MRVIDAKIRGLLEKVGATDGPEALFVGRRKARRLMAASFPKALRVSPWRRPVAPSRGASGAVPQLERLRRRRWGPSVPLRPGGGGHRPRILSDLKKLNSTYGTWYEVKYYNIISSRKEIIICTNISVDLRVIFGETSPEIRPAARSQGEPPASPPARQPASPP